MRRHESNLPFGGPAFPFVFDDGRQRNVYTGMNLRDDFAGKAMSGLLGAGRDAQYGDAGIDDLARAAYRIADAMLKAREE
jgi:hypothetical protein